MKSIPASVDGDFVLIQYGSGFPNVVLAGGDRPSLAARGYKEGRIYTYAGTQRNDPSFEEYAPGKWRRHEHSIWNRRLAAMSELSNATVYCMPRYRGVLVSQLAWPLFTANGSVIQVVLDRPSGLMSSERPDVASIADPRTFFPSSLQHEQTKYQALMPKLQMEGWKSFMGDGGWYKDIPITDLEFEPERDIPSWLREAIARGG